MMEDSHGEQESAMACVQRSITDFLIHPTTVNMEDQYSFEDAAKPMPVGPPYHALTLESAKQTLDPSRDLKEQSIYSRGYASEEELASPVDNDDFSFGSLDSDVESLVASDNASTESLTYTQPQCSRAQAVQVMSVGKAKVISMPRIVDDSPVSPISRPTTSSDSGPLKTSFDIISSGGIGRVSVRSDRWSPRTSEEAWQSSPSRIIGADYINHSRPLRRRPLPLHVPQSESSREMALIPKTPVTTQTVNIMDDDMYTTGSGSPSPPSSRMKRRAYKLPSAFNLKTLSWNMKQNNRSSGNADRSAPSPNQPEMKSRSFSVANINAPAPAPRKPLPKMVPRGANERAPPIVLPPCPYDDEDDDDGDDESHSPWASKKESPSRPTGILPYQPIASYGTGERRKSLPAFVSTEV